MDVSYSLVGILDEDGATVHYRRVELPLDPDTTVAVVRAMFRRMFTVDPTTLDRYRLPDNPSPDPHHPHHRIPPRVQADLRAVVPAEQDKWLYLVNPYTNQFHVFEADTDRAWQHHGTHDL
ncbi:hypothetical protein AB0J84_08300 [Micromonospora arborensis]|uniref:hypothetical protein n=1 Tax=Micromonospora arborensis TaxID=2116518 RepID=UPI0011B66118|nr:hypothetical protein [Micromonospora arborensis]